MTTATAKPERLLSMTGPLVLETRAGRKTQTRRVMKVQPKRRPFQVQGEATGDWFTENPEYPRRGPMMNGRWRCPYGQPGDVIGIREAAWMWCERVPNGTTPSGRNKWKYAPLESVPPVYCADHPKRPTPLAHMAGIETYCWRWKAPRFLPRWAVRSRVQIEGIRVERVQDISEADAKAEGLQSVWSDDQGETPGRVLYFTGADPEGKGHAAPRAAFRVLWNHINAARGHSWESNPWCWVVTYKLEEAR